MSPHRQSHGICALCGYRAAKAAMARHLTVCIPAHDVVGAAPARLFRLRVEALEAPLYWLDVEIKAGARLRALDQFLRDA